MKFPHLRWAMLGLGLMTFAGAQAQFTAGRVAVLRIGDGSTALSASCNRVAIVEVNPSSPGTATEIAVWPTAAGSAVGVSANATSEGMLNLSSDGYFLSGGGYRANIGTANIAGTTAASVSRVGMSVVNSGTVATVGSTNSLFSAGNIRAYALVNQNLGYAVGQNSGVVRLASTNNNIQVCTTLTNLRALQVYNGRLYTGTGSATNTIQVVGGTYNVATNTYSGQSTNLTSMQTGVTVFNTRAANSSPYQFQFINETTCYVATDVTTTNNGGVEKYVWSSGAWTYQYTFGTNTAAGNWTVGARGLWVDNSGANPVLYYTTAETDGNRLLRVVDAGSAALPTLLYTAPANYRLRGVAGSPIAQPITPTQLSVTSINGGNPITAGRTFSITVKSTDGSNNEGAVTSATGVSLSVNTGTLNGTTTGTISNNGTTVTFSGLSVTGATGTVTLTATQTSGTPSLTAGTADLTVLEQASQLTFASLPASGLIDNNLSTFTVTARRTDNSIETTHPGSVTLSKASGPGTISGTLTQNFVNGVASFNNVQFNTVGTVSIQASSSNPTLSATSSTISLTDGSTTYVWLGTGGNKLWSNANNWGDPNNANAPRTTPAATDRLIINTSDHITFDISSSETVSRLTVTDNAAVRLLRRVGTVCTLNVGNGAAGQDLIINAGASLILNSNVTSGAINVIIPATNTGQIAGTFKVAGYGANTAAAHRLLPTDASSLEFLAGGTCLADTNFSGNLFGNAGTANTVIFRNGSRFVFRSGSNPFGLGAPASKVTFEQTSVFEVASLTAGASPAVSTRNYDGIFEWNSPFAFSNSFTGTCNVNRFRVATGATFNLRLQGAAPFVIDTLDLMPNSSFYINQANGTGLSSALSIFRVKGHSTATLKFGGASTTLNFDPANNTVNNLRYAQSGGTLTIGNAVNVVNRFSADTGTVNANGNVTILSTATQTGFIPVTTGTISGSVTFQRWINGLFTQVKSARHVASPVAATTVNDLTNGQSIVASDLEAWNENSNPAVPGSGWVSYSNGSNTLVPGVGYSYKTTAGYALDLTGTPNSGNIDVSCTRSQSGWNLLGNPYPQPLDWDAVTLAGNGFDNTKFFSGRYQWLSATGSLGAWQPYVNGIPASRRYVPTLGAFLVRVKTGNASATFGFRNAMRATPAGAINFGRPTEADSRPVIEMSLTAQGQVVADEAAVYFQDGANDAFNGAMDATKLTSSGLASLYTTIGSTNYGIKGLAMPTVERVIPMGVRVPVSGSHTLRFTNLDNMDVHTAYLVDQVAGTSTQIFEGMNYSFDLTANTASDRFSIRFVPGVTSSSLQAGNEKISLYPNPSREGKVLVNVLDAAREGSVTVKVTNALGQQVYQTQSDISGTQGQCMIPTSQMAKGVYLVQIATPSQTISQKLIVE